jgi:cytidylate kinase
MALDLTVPVIAIDGPSASGKGTIAAAVASALGFHYLDSGALYRVVGVVAAGRGLNLDSDVDVTSMSLNLRINFTLSGGVTADDVDLTEAIRSEVAGAAASRVAALPGVRAALLDLQKGFLRPPGLVADGRDMGSVVFPDAAVKIFLTATAEERAERRYKQLIGKGLGANIIALLQDIRERDLRDSSRASSPLQKCADALEIDSTGVSIDRVVARVLAAYRDRTGQQ